MDDWGVLDDFELQDWKGPCICITCQHVNLGVDRQCRPLAGCTLKKKTFKHGEHLSKRCSQWSPTWQKHVDCLPDVC